jgi:processive 1,2-diacylglycerol beta-glucosyltransferase
VILVLTAGFGDGHNTAARSVAQALAAEPVRASLPVEVLDHFVDSVPRVTRLLQAAYQVAIVQYPQAWRWAYRKLANPGFTHGSNPLTTRLRNTLRMRLENDRPSLLVSTYPFYATLLAPLREEGIVPPLFTVITDSVSIHPSWTDDPSEHYAVADEESREVLVRRGIDPATVTVTGFPVSPRFAVLEPEQEREGKRILYLPSTPVRHVAATLEALEPLIRAGARLTLPAGKHLPRLFHTINRFTDRLPRGSVEVIGWTDRMPDLLRAHDLVICKAGGAIMHEVLAARVPAVIDYVVPGQEEGNAEMLLSHQCALLSRDPAETGRHAAAMLADDAALAKTMRARMVPPLSVPDAAHRAARAILTLLPPDS